MQLWWRSVEESLWLALLVSQRGSGCAGARVLFLGEQSLQVLPCVWCKEAGHELRD